MQQLTRARCVLEETKEFSDEEIRAAVNRILFLQEVGLLKIIPQRVPPFVSSIKRYSSSFEQDLLQSPLPGMIEFGHLTVSGYETATFRSNDYAIVLKYLRWQLDHCKKLQHQVLDFGMHVKPRDVSAMGVSLLRQRMFEERARLCYKGKLRRASQFWT